MNGIVIDASVTLSWCFPDEQTPASMNVLDRLKAGGQAFVPAFWAAEVLNPTLDYTSLEQVAGPIQIICRDHRLTPYDALYIELAMRSGCPLATLDRPQREAAAALGVPCL